MPSNPGPFDHPTTDGGQFQQSRDSDGAGIGRFAKQEPVVDSPPVPNPKTITQTPWREPQPRRYIFTPTNIASSGAFGSYRAMFWSPLRNSESKCR